MSGAFAKIAVASVVAVAMSQASQACECAQKPSPKVALATSTAVFAGIVTRVESFEQGLRLSLQPSAIWKGENREEIQVWTESNTAACGYGFREGKSYLVYAETDEKKLHVSLCGRTQVLEGSRADVAELGEPRFRRH